MLIVDCVQGVGVITLSLTRLPDEHWAPNQNTPLCTTCDYNHRRCHYCRGQLWVAPAANEYYFILQIVNKDVSDAISDGVPTCCSCKSLVLSSHLVK